MKDCLIGLSGGINSAAVLCWLIEQEDKPETVHLYYAHFKQHSPDTFDFITDLVIYARKHFKNVKVEITINDVLDFFERIKMIPHPVISPCSRKLKIEPIKKYGFDEGLTIDLVGYIRHELKRRSERAQMSVDKGLFDMETKYPIGDFTDEWCFEIVKKHIGWYPAIYDIRDSDGERVFKHNNCLPCKNMTTKQLEAVKEHYPKYHMEAMRLSEKLSRHWGRSADEFYSTFGRDLGQESTCEHCKL
jgi:hypothetical protein